MVNSHDSPLIYLVIPFQDSPEWGMQKMMEKYLQERNLCSTFVPAKKRGAIAQLVEQRTENPCVPGSIPGGTTSERQRNGFALGHLSWSFFYVHTPERTPRTGTVENGSVEETWGKRFP